jgi:PAS domain S-box-containing protein
MLEIAALHEVVYDASGRATDYRILDCNAAFTRILGIARETARGSLASLLYGTSPAPYLEVYARVVQTGVHEAFETYFPPLDKHFQISVVPMEGGQFATLATDITDRKRSEEALRRSEEGLRAAQSVSHVGSWTWHVQTGRLEWSEEMFRIFGIERANFSGNLEEVIARAIHPEDQAAVAFSNQEVLQAGRPAPLEYRLCHPDGSVRTVWAEAGALRRDQAGRPELLTGIVMDITERRAVEAQLRQAQKMESVGLLAGGIAHDFNNILAVILGYASSALADLAPGQPLREDLQEIQQAARRSADLTRQLLAFARKQAISPAVLDLNATVAGTLKMLQRMLGEDIRLAWRPGRDLWPTKVDPSQLDQILANLCVNARDAIADVGTLTIETGNVSCDGAACAGRSEATPGDYVRLVVSDDGCGMDQATLARIFEPFFTTKAHGKGTGLGLATLYGIVTQNAGFIDVESEPGSGTTFTIYLPRHLGPDRPASMAAPSPTASPGHETILLVEDEPAILRVARRMLERQGYLVLAASTPREALRLAAERAGQVHLLLTDAVMPEMNGHDLATRLLAAHPGLKLLFMSGYSANVIPHQGVQADSLNFIQKPFLAEELTAAVRAALAR